MDRLKEVHFKQCMYLRDLSELASLSSLKQVNVEGCPISAFAEDLEELKSNNTLVVVHDSFDSINSILDGGFHGAQG